MDRKDEENILVQDESRPDTCVQSRYLGNALYEASLTGTDSIEQSLIALLGICVQKNELDSTGQLRYG
jgi:hypothetical protein